MAINDESFIEKLRISLEANIPSPKFKVGDRVTYKGEKPKTGRIVAVTHPAIYFTEFPKSAQIRVVTTPEFFSRYIYTVFLNKESYQILLQEGFSEALCLMYGEDEIMREEDWRTRLEDKIDLLE